MDYIIAASRHGLFVYLSTHCSSRNAFRARSAP